MDNYIIRWLDKRGSHERNFRWQEKRAAGFYKTITEDLSTREADLLAVNPYDEDDFEILAEYKASHPIITMKIIISKSDSQLRQ